MNKKKSFLTIVVLSIVLSSTSFAQGKLYEGPDDPAGDPAMRREGWMNGNRVFLYFRNSTELSNCCGTRWSKWPNNPDGLSITDGIALLVGARVFVQDGVPVTDPSEISSSSNLDTLYYCQTSYREETDYSPTGDVQWGFHPVKGYFNLNDEYLAMSNIESSWPLDGWPSTGSDIKWPGEWNGRFGRGVQYADLETYFVANDAQDQEKIFEDETTGPIVKYLPRPNVFIGNKDPDVSVQNGDPWGGLGIRASVRSFQWNNVQARDNIFFEYDLANISEYDLANVAFGYWVDNGIGNNDPDDIGYFDTYEDMSYSWDIDGIGDGGRKTGVFGFAYLESPGVAYDGIDNDDDGLIDEQRDNDAGSFVGPLDGIDDLEKYLKFSGKTLEELKDHWSGDEDQDWEDGIDENNDGIYDEDEYYGDDVGLDGVGPVDLNYTGPDEGEANHKPDYKEGIGGEPNFAALDISESDMIGLTTFQLFPIPEHESPYHNWFRHDEDIWNKLSSDRLEEFSGKTANLVEFFASGVFPLYQGRTERISMAMVHSFDLTENLNNSSHYAPILFKQKEIVQGIYETDYRFAQPPEMPTLQAYALDGKVVLFWDDRADTKTHDPFIKNVNDFEGYKLYRATDMYFSDAEVITDGFGTSNILKPIFECDLKNEYFDFAEWGEVNGQGFYLGANTGIVHYYEDKNVDNGKTYYYGLAAYDYGIKDFGVDGIGPSENNLVIDLDEFGEIRNLGKNIQIITPRTNAAGFVEPSFEMLDGATTELHLSPFEITIFNQTGIEKEKTYKVKFGYGIDSSAHYMEQENIIHHTDFTYMPNRISFYDITDGVNNLIYEETQDKFGLSNMEPYNEYLKRININGMKTELIDGFTFSIKPNYDTVTVNYEKTGWLVGNSDVNFVINEKAKHYFPWEYEIVFTEDDSNYSTIEGMLFGMIDEKGNLLSNANLLRDYRFNFYVNNKSFVDSTDAYERLDVMPIDADEDGVFNPKIDYYLAGVHVEFAPNMNRWSGSIFRIDFNNISDEANYPKANDVYNLTFNRKLGFNDSISFKIKPSIKMDKGLVKATMEQIKVVPNPYVAGNTMEEANTIVSAEQKRKIMFTHLPAQCKIMIFTTSGVLVDEILVNNSADDGKAYWDLQTREDLEIAAGVYIFHVKAEVTGDEKIGKFVVIK